MMWGYSIDVGTTITNQPFGNGLYDLFMAVGGWHIIVLPTLPLLVGGFKHILISISYMG